MGGDARQNTEPVSLGIEGGGTRAIALLADARGQILKRLELGPLNLKVASDGQILATLRRIRSAFGPPPSALGLCLAGCRTAADSAADGATRGLINFVCSMRWDAARVGARIEQAAAWGRDHHAAVLLGEFGASRALNAPARLAWLEAVRLACAQRGIGWALWGYDDVMGFGIDPHTPARAAMDRATLSALGLGSGG